MATDPELPKFDALREYLDKMEIATGVKTPIHTWINKLEEWSKDRLEELEAAEDQVRSWEEAGVEDENVAETLKSIDEAMHDVRLGIMTTEEFFETWRDPTPPWIGEWIKGGETRYIPPGLQRPERPE